jgi:hypothetical protein
MRRLAGLALLSASTLLAAPQKEQLPAGAIGRLGTQVSPAKDEKRPGEINALAFVSDETIFVGTNAGWNTWDLTKQKVNQAKPVGGPAFSVSVAPKQVWVGSVKKLHVIEPPSSAMAEPAQSWDSANESVLVLAISPGGRRVVFSDGDMKLALLDATHGKVAGAIELASRPVTASLTANGRLLAVVTRDGAVRTYQLASNGGIELLWTKRIARSDHVAAGFSPDGRLFAASSAGRLVVLESVTGRQLLGLERKFGEGDVRSLAFSPSGRQLAAGSNGPEAVVRVWSLDNGGDQGSFLGHLGDVNAVAFSPNGQTLASAGSDQAVLLWKVPPAPPTEKPLPLKQAWDNIDSLDAPVGYRAMSSFLEERVGAVATIRDGFRDVEDEPARIRRWVKELDHDEFRVREAARRNLVKAGLRAAAVLVDPKRKPLGAEGEQRVKSILEAFESQGLRIPESGMFGESLRAARAVRVLEVIGSKEAKAALEEFAKGDKDSRLAREAKAALETWPEQK